MTTTKPMTEPLSPELRAAYEAARYEVTLDDGSVFVLRHGARHPQLDAALQRCDPTATSWAVVTAWNPFSNRLSRDENDERQRALRARIAALGLATFDAVGRDDASDWHEESLLVVGLDEAAACALGSQFCQHAVFVGAVGEPAAVCFCPDSTLF